MKVFVALVLVIASVSARGSGPYLPSGWKPQGPAFYLPSEVAKPAPSSIQEPVFLETEASGSDALREYGPPKLEVSFNINQALPDVATEQTFLVEVKNEEAVAAAEEAVSFEANTEQVAAFVEEVSTATESQIVEAVEAQTSELSDAQPTVEAQEITEQVAEISEVVESQEALPTAAAVEEIVVPTSVAAEEIVVPTSVAAEEIVVPTAFAAKEIVVPTAYVAEDIVVPATAEEEVVVTLAQQELAVGVNNIAEALVTLEQEVKAAEVQAIEAVAEISSTQEASGSLDQAPEGFLEYGPPGFTEYGPPKEDAIARLAVEVASASALENNEVRRRRFSPKFRSTKKH